MSGVYAIRNLKDEMKGNPTLCLSAKRATRQCQNCDTFKGALRKHHGNLDETLKHMQCRPLLTEEAVAFLKELERVREKLAKIEEEEDNINSRLEKIHG